MVLAIIIVVCMLGAYLYLRKKKVTSKGGEGGKEKDEWQDPTKPIYKN